MDIYNSKFIQKFRDLKYFFEFRRQMKKFAKDPYSEFNKLGLKVNRFGNIVYTQLNCSDNDFMNAGYNHAKMIEMKSRKIIDYFNELDWGDYVTLQVQNFEDAETHEPSLSYGLLFIYNGYALTMTNAFWTLLIFLLLLICGIVACIIFI